MRWKVFVLSSLLGCSFEAAQVSALEDGTTGDATTSVADSAPATEGDGTSGGTVGMSGSGSSAGERTSGPGTTSTTAATSSTSGGVLESSSSSGSNASATSGNSCDNVSLPVTLRDFRVSHPDMEFLVAVDPGIVEPQLGADGLPVYAGGTAGTTNGQASFDQWYRDVPGINETVPFELQLMEEPDGSFSYDDAAFFPLDDQAFGNEGNSHNYHFTLELHTTFTYESGEVFTFRGDDDVFVFINDRLAIDLGGVHAPLEATIDMDASAGALGIEVGQTYDLDLFFAERHTSQSNFRIQTSIGCFLPPPG